MSLSVSSFPEAPAKLLNGQKRQKQSPSQGESKRAFFGTFLSKGSVPFLKRIRHFTKVNVNIKGSVIHHEQHHPEKVPPSRSHSRHPSSVASSPIKASGIVIDLIGIPHKDEYFPPSKGGDADATSFREPWPSPPTTLTASALSFPSVTNHVSATAPTPPPPPPPPPPTVPNDDPASHHPLRNHAQPSERDGEIAPVVDNLTSHDSQASAPSAKPPAELSRRRSRAVTSPTSSTTSPFFVTVTTASPTSQSPMAQLPAAPTSTEGRVRSRSISTSVKRAATAETVPVQVPAPPSRPRYKSETSIGVRDPITLTPNDIPQVKRRGRGKSSPTAPLPSGIPLPKHQLQQQQQEQQQQPQPQERGESRPKRVRQLSNSSGRSGTGAGAGSSNIAPGNQERSSSLQVPSRQQQQQPSQNNPQPLLTGHMLCMRSGSRPLPSTTHTHQLLSVSGRPSTAHAHAGARSNPSTTTRVITATSLLVPRLSPEQMSADKAYDTRQRPRTTDGASASSRPRTPSTSLPVRSSEGTHNQVLPPPPTLQTPTLGSVVDGGGRRSRLPVLNTQARAATAAAIDRVGSEVS